MWRRKGGQGTSRIFFFQVAVTKTGKSAKFFVFLRQYKNIELIQSHAELGNVQYKVHIQYTYIFFVHMRSREEGDRVGGHAYYALS